MQLMFKTKHHLWSVVSPVIQRFLASPWFSAFHPRISIFQRFSKESAMGNLCTSGAVPPRSASCANVNIGQVTLLERPMHSGDETCCGPTTRQQHVDPDESGKKSPNPWMIFHRFCCSKKKLKKIRACNYAENKKPYFCLHPV